MKTFEAGELTIQINVSHATLKLHWLGKSVARDPANVLKPFFDNIKAYAAEREIELDFRHFEFMNSSTVKPILTFVQDTSKQARSIHVRYDSSKTWQRLSFGLLKALSPTWDNVSVEG